MDLHRYTGESLAEFSDRLSQNLLRRLRLLGDLGLVVADAGDGEQVFHHADQPLGVVPGVCQQGLLLRLGEVWIFQHGGGGADDGGQGRADVVGDGAEQIRPHLDLLIFQPEPVLFLGLCGQRAGHQGDHQKGEDGQRIAGNGEVEGHIGICKDVVDADDSQDRRDQPEEVAVCKTGDQQHRQHIDGRGKAVRGVSHLVEQGADAGGAEEDEGGDQKVPPGKGEDMANAGFESLQGRFTPFILG